MSTSVLSCYLYVGVKTVYSRYLLSIVDNGTTKVQILLRKLFSLSGQVIYVIIQNSCTRIESFLLTKDNWHCNQRQCKARSLLLSARILFWDVDLCRVKISHPSKRRLIYLIGSIHIKVRHEPNPWIAG